MVGELTHTGCGCGVFSIEWRIPDFLSLDGRSYYDSPYFVSCGRRWCLRIHPKGLRGEPPSGWLSLELYRVGTGQSETLDVTLGLRGTEGVENRKRKKQEFSDGDYRCLWTGFCRREHLVQHSSRLMPGSTLAIAVEMRRDEPSVTEDTSTQTEESELLEVATEGNESSDKRGGEEALEDFGKLLASGENSDVTIQLDDVEFKVHSFVLFARCPALSVSLRHESKEKLSKKIVVEDCHPDVFRDFLHYLYTGSVQSLSGQTVFALYCLADKYLAKSLKLHCVEHIRDTLSVQTFCDAVKLALIYGEGGLLQKAIDFASKNIRSILCSVPWQDFVREHPIESSEIILKSLGPP